jgi:hypothetical protein
MFERYNDAARRTIFFGRYEASRFGSSYIETEHLLLGLLREDKALTNRLVGSRPGVESIRKQIEQHSAPRQKVSTSVDMPLSHECQRVLAGAAEEAARLKQQHIGAEHLLLGLLREEQCFAAQLLRQEGLTLESVREQVQKSEPHFGQAGSALSARLDQWLSEREARGGIWTVRERAFGNRTTHFAIYASETPRRVPLLCIEIIGDERFFEIRKRCDDYIAEGITQVWLLEPESKRAYTVTGADGLREFRGGTLQIADPPLEMNLRMIFE